MIIKKIRIRSKAKFLEIQVILFNYKFEFLLSQKFVLNGFLLALLSKMQKTMRSRNVPQWGINPMYVGIV